MIGFDPLYLIIMLPLLLIGIAASIFLRVTYSNYSKKINDRNLNGRDVATRIAERYGFNISLDVGYGNLTDNYNPLNRTVTLSQEVAKMPSIASVGIAAHEMGHVAQHHNSFLLTSIRTTIAPVVSIGSSIGYFLIILGLILSVADLAWIGVILFAGTTVFTFITLPVEFDASRRAIKMIKELELVSIENINGVRMVLFAAALTYVAALLQSLGNLLYFVLRIRGINSRD
jgi:hypothetical protein